MLRTTKLLLLSSQTLPRYFTKTPPNPSTLSNLKLNVINLAAPSISTLSTPNQPGVILNQSTSQPYYYQPTRSYAARKGTRARKEAKKVKKVVEKKDLVFKHGRKRLVQLQYKPQRPFDNSHYPTPIDNVYFIRKFQTKCYPFNEAIQCMREVHHPTVYNVPNAPVHLRVNLDLKYPNRATKTMDPWKSVIEMQDPFLMEGMSKPAILAFCIEDVDYIDRVVKEGDVEKAGGKELIKLIQTGEVSTNEYEYLIAHPEVLQELTAIRGLIKKKFPTIRQKTIDTDLVSVARRLKSGIKVHVVKNDREPDFGYIDTPIGMLDQTNLYGNFVNILVDTFPKRVPNKSINEFVISCVLKTPGNGFEEFKIDLSSELVDEVEEIVKRKKEEAAEGFK